MIDTGTKPNGEEYMAYNVRRWGGDGWTSSLRSSGAKVGCMFKKWATWPNTFKTHCLLTAALNKGVQKNVLDDIFTECYENGGNVSDIGTLDKIA